MRNFLFENIDLVINLSNIEQVYLSEEYDIRIRKRDFYMYDEKGSIKKKYTNYTLTEKSGEGLSREELTITLNSQEYNVLKKLAVYPPLLKTRFLFKMGEELDSYDNEVYIMEKEFDSVVDSETYVPWFEDVIKSEVTTNLYYTNKQIAKRGGVFE